MTQPVELRPETDRYELKGSMFGKVRNLYFVGIGGAGMSGIAEVLHNLGFQVQGSDHCLSDITAYLESLGIGVFGSHQAANVKEADVVVISSAIAENNPEVMEAQRRGIPVIKRAEMLGELMRLKFSIAVAGTHGKTTTTSMIGRILQWGRYQPTIIVGGVVSDLGTGAALGGGDYLVAEADEYDRSFLSMFPTMAVVTNIEADHLDCYDDMSDLLQSYLSYMNRVPFYGSVVLSADDPNLSLLKHQLTRPFAGFGFAPEADYRVDSLRMAAEGSNFSLYARGNLLGDVQLRVPGRHNVANAMAAAAACCELEVPFSTVAEGLADFKGVGRRFQIIGEANDILVVDDYAHHPTEIQAVLTMAKQLYDRRVVVIYQPHLFSRTRDFMDEFAEVLAIADKCLLVDIYPAREEPIEGITSKAIVDRAAQKGIGNFFYVGDRNQAVSAAAAVARPGDIIITMGAGSITLIKESLLKALGKVG